MSWSIYNAEISEDAKYPMLLPRQEHFVNLVIQEVHERMILAGKSHTLFRSIGFHKGEEKELVYHTGLPSSCFSLPMMPPWPKMRVPCSFSLQARIIWVLY